MKKRTLSAYEKELLCVVLEKWMLSKLEIEKILNTVCVEDIHPEDKDWHHVELSYANRNHEDGGYTIIADWDAKDLDGAYLDLLVLGDRSGYPFELQINRPDTQPIQRLPQIFEWKKRVNG